ncbi:MAG: transposase, partial [Candidatus Scalindua sp.]|nr:transposase [Candidatus Scalindua sp.]
MSRKKASYTADFKSNVVLELLESGLTLNEVASKHKILPNNLKNWKKQFLSNMSIAFDKKQVV